MLRPIWSSAPSAIAPLCAMILGLPLALALSMLGDGLLTPVTAIGSQAVITIAFSLVIVPLVAHATIADIPTAKRARFA